MNLRYGTRRATPIRVPGSIRAVMDIGGSLKASQFHRLNRLRSAPLARFSTLLLVCEVGLLAGAQTGVLSPYQGAGDGIRAGGKWMEFHSEDTLSGAPICRVESCGRIGLETAEFSPAAMKRARVKQARDVTPKKPSKT